MIFPASNAPGYPPDDITTHTAGSADQRKSPSLTRPSIDASIASSRSLSIRITMGCVSGSPSRQLNSSTIGPRAVIMMPQYRMPLYSAPSAFMPAITGRATCATSQSRIPASMIWSVEYAPMPPVLGPWSLSKTRLWSCVATSGATRSPSLITRNDSSSPSRNSSNTTRDPASPSILPLSISSAVRFPFGRRDHPALARRQSVGLNHDRSVEVGQRVLQLFLLGADGIMRRRNPVPLHEFFGEALARLQLCRCFGWPEDRASAALEFVNYAQCQGKFGADNGDIGIQPAGQLDNRIEALQIDGHALCVAANSAAAGSAVQLLDARRLPQLPRDCVFAATATEDEYLHRESFAKKYSSQSKRTMRKERVGL